MAQLAPNRITDGPAQLGKSLALRVAKLLASGEVRREAPKAGARYYFEA